MKYVFTPKKTHACVKGFIQSQLQNSGWMSGNPTFCPFLGWDEVHGGSMGRNSSSEMDPSGEVDRRSRVLQWALHRRIISCTFGLPEVPTVGERVRFISNLIKPSLISTFLVITYHLRLALYFFSKQRLCLGVYEHALARIIHQYYLALPSKQNLGTIITATHESSGFEPMVGMT